MKQAGDVEFCSVMADESGRSKGVGFVRFADESGAQNAIAMLNGSEMNGKTLMVDLWTGAKPKTIKGSMGSKGGTFMSGGQSPKGAMGGGFGGFAAGKGGGGGKDGMWVTWEMMQN